MSDTILFFAYHSLTLLFGVVLSVAFCGLRFTKKNDCAFLSLLIFCSILQLVVFNLLGEKAVWELYPLITHLPLLLLLCLAFRKRVATVTASISLAYLCCQPSKWIGLLVEAFIQSDSVVWSIRIFVMLLVAFIAIRFLASYISEIFNKDTRSVLIFASVPLIYYAFDYFVGVYTDLWASHYRIVAEFLAFFLCVIFMAFCVVYYKEYEKKADAERKEQILSITAQQRAKEVTAIKQSSMETSLLRHDMRLLLSNLALSIEKDDKEASLKMISGFVTQVEAASVHRYCKNDTVNYVLANFEGKCKEQQIDFCVTVELDELAVDEIMFSSIISNALDNALNAQTELPPTDRKIKLMLKDSGGKLLLSVKNTFAGTPVFIDGLPTTNRKGHGYGTQSIRYMTEKLGGKCQFSTHDNIFILRVVL